MAETVTIEASRRGVVSAPAATVETLVVAMALAVLSLLHTGFVFGIENNLFHLPIIAGLYHEPQYQDDAFIQSLRHFASGVWLMLAGTERSFGHPELQFFALQYLSRLLTFTGLLCCASLLGIVERREKIVFGLIVCFHVVLAGYSHAGNGGLFLNYFTHSEMANGTVLLAIWFAAKGRFAAATVAAGATFFINAFVAVWLAPVLALVAIDLVLRRRARIGAVAAGAGAGAVLCIPLVLPVLREIVSNPEFGQPLSFDFAAYLREYYPGHVLIDEVAPADILRLLAVMAAGATALWWFGVQSRGLALAYAAAILVYALGVGLPFVTHSPMVLNLHLLRSSTIIHLLAALALAALATVWLRPDRRNFLPGCILVLVSSLEGIAFVIAVPLILAARFLPSGQASGNGVRRALGYGLLAATAVLVWPWSTWQNHWFNTKYAEGVREWTAVGEWARRSTPSSALFLVPPGEGGAQLTVSQIALARAAVFEFTSHRRLWVDVKRGAAVMWTPSYYRTWRSRVADVRGLTSLDERIAYARRHGIDYVVDLCEPSAVNLDAVFRTEGLCVVRVQAAPDHGAG